MYLLQSVLRKISGLRPGEKTVPLKELSTFQMWFCQWNSKRLNISLEESIRRYRTSWELFPAGHGGNQFRNFNDLSYQLFFPFFPDSEDALFEAYQYYGILHFLRMLSYDADNWNGKSFVQNELSELKEVNILDFGCGLAQRSIGLARYLKHSGVQVELFLADIPTIRKDFLLWTAGETGIKTNFLDCTREKPLPDLPDCHLCIATEVFEHLTDPMAYLKKMDFALQPGGFLLTGVYDHFEEFMHVSPKLSPLREELIRLKYTEIEPYTLYRKSV
jgi:SAM-dependent methyltransferase